MRKQPGRNAHAVSGVMSSWTEARDKGMALASRFRLLYLKRKEL
jgi:hypothetical protein